MQESHEQTATKALVATTTALALMLASASLMNVVVFPQFDTVFTFARDTSVTAGAISLLALGAIARFCPQKINPNLFVGCMMTLCLAGGVLLIVGLAEKLPITLTIGASLTAIGRTGTLVVVGLATTQFSRRDSSIIVVSAFLVARLVKAVFWFIPIWLGVTVFLLIPFACVLMTWFEAKPLFEATTQSEAPADVAITRPSSFLPLAAQVFLCIFLFRIAFGFSLRFGETGGVPVSDFLIIIPVALMAGHVLFSKHIVPSDLLAAISVLLVVAGFLFVTANSVDLLTVSNVLLSAGSTMFDLVAWTVLLAIGSRNPAGALTTFAWGNGLSSAGSLVGAALGMWSNYLFASDRMILALVTGSFIVLFVGYALIGLKKFSFAETIEGINPVSHAVIRNPEQEFDACCGSIAQEFGLTPRELEVLMMLARGRDRTYIQEQLVVSRNTVKAHVKHVYAKLDIHAHQDLIELVDHRMKEHAESA